MAEPKTFKITWADEEAIVEGRSAAVEFAKAKSAEVPMNVNVESNDENSTSTISMTYNGGSLEVYVAETKTNEKRSRRRDRSEDEMKADDELDDDLLDDESDNYDDSNAEA